MGGILSGIGASKAAKNNARAANNATAMQVRGQRNAARAIKRRTGQAIDLLDASYGDPGQQGLAQGTMDYYMGLANALPEGVRGFETTPGYAHRVSEGVKAIQNSAAARGGLNSGATMKAIQRFGQDYASNEFGNYYNRLMDRGAVDRNFSNNKASILLDEGRQLGNIYTGIGNSQAAGTIAAANQRGMATQALFGIPQAQHSLDLATAGTAAQLFGGATSFMGGL